MVTIHETNYQILLEILPNLPDMQMGDACRLTSPGYMDLTVDILYRVGDELRIALAHRYEQRGDLVPDPDMEIRVYLGDHRMAEALTYQDSRRYDVVYPKPGRVHPALKRSLNNFLNGWLNNLRQQGHAIAR